MELKLESGLPHQEYAVEAISEVFKQVEINQQVAHYSNPVIDLRSNRFIGIYTAYSKGSGRMWRKNTETSSRWATPCVWTSRWKQAQARHTYIHTPSLNCTNVMA